MSDFDVEAETKALMRAIWGSRDGFSNPGAIMPALQRAYNAGLEAGAASRAGGAGTLLERAANIIAGLSANNVDLYRLRSWLADYRAASPVKGTGGACPECEAPWVTFAGGEDAGLVHAPTCSRRPQQEQGQGTCIECGGNGNELVRIDGGLETVTCRTCRGSGKRGRTSKRTEP